MINKYDYRKTNDKKVLHKIGKQWKVISVALLIAIGGGAVATQAHADGNVNAATQTEVNALEQKPSVARPTSASAVSAGGQQSAGSAASSDAAVSYLSGDNGSAASYHAQASNDRAVQSSAQAFMTPYIKSLNSQFPFVTSVLSSVAQSAQQKAQSSNSLASSYANTASASDTQSVINQSAAKASMTPTNFVNSVQSQVSVNAASMSAASIDKQTISDFYSLAGSLYTKNWSSAAADAATQFQFDRVQSSVADVTYGMADNTLLSVVNASESNAMALTRAQAMLTSVNGARNVARINQPQDRQTLNSLTASLGYVNSSAVSAAVSSLADQWDLDTSTSDAVSLPVNSGTSMSGVDFAYVAGHLNNSAWAAHNSASVAFYQLVSDAAALQNTSSATNSLVSAISSYRAAQPQYTRQVSSANAAFHRVIADSNSTSYAYQLNSEQSAVMSNLSLSNQDSTTFYSNKAAVNLLYDLSHGYANLAHSLGSTSNNLNDSSANLSALESNVAYNHLNLVYMAQNANEIQSVGADINNAYNHNGFNLSAAMNTVNSSIAANYATTQSISDSYAQSTNASVTAASYLATSYANDTASYDRNASNERGILTAFYDNYVDQPFMSAQNADKQAKADEPHADALANAYGLRVYNYAPKYVTVLKNAFLHTNPEYSDQNAIEEIHRGTELKVLGVGFAKDGTVHYLINYNGKTGYFTSKPNYVRKTYVQRAGLLNVTMLKPAKVYAKPDFSQYTGHTVATNQQLKNVKVVSLDDTYGGFTNLETADGHFITANTEYVKLDVPNQAASSPINFWE